MVETLERAIGRLDHEIEERLELPRKNCWSDWMRLPGSVNESRKSCLLKSDGSLLRSRMQLIWLRGWASVQGSMKVGASA